jgi:beta-1,4-N-acetylglucosaminyltransferase
MILVTVGTHTEGFERLVKAMDRIAFETGEEVVIQRGATRYTPQAARWFDFAPASEMARLSREARVIVSHAGSGSILTSLSYGKPLIVMPRLKKYGEHMDDHQLELTNALSEAGRLLVALEADDLPARLAEALTFKPRPSERGRLLEALQRTVLEELPRRGRHPAPKSVTALQGARARAQAEKAETPGYTMGRR